MGFVDPRAAKMNEWERMRMKTWKKFLDRNEDRTTFKPPKGFKDWKAPKLNIELMLIAMRRIRDDAPMSWELPNGRTRKKKTSDEQFCDRFRFTERIRFHRYP
jgi:hypothetical protein